MPLGFGAYEDMRLWLYAWITLNRAERYSGNITFVGSC
jgi:hypothetical protein